MLFQSPGFLVLLCVAFVVFQALEGFPRAQKWLLLLASFVFYYSWEAAYSRVGVTWETPQLGEFRRFLPALLPLPIYLGLLLLLTLVTYAGALVSARVGRQWVRRAVVTAVVLLTIAPLLWFKYRGFGVGSVLLPLGISFFTFQAIAYSVDVYRDPRLASKSLLDVSLFLLFFANLLAGPIMRADEQLTQVERMEGSDARRIFEGHFFLLRGLVKKVALADLLGLVVDPVYDNLGGHSWALLIIVSALYGFQIYFDFSGYSDMAVGIGKYFGFNLRENFRLPYFAKSPSEFWTRWHITLMSWFRDYVYEPLGGNLARVPSVLAIVIVTFVASGLWHGARWTFIVWGAYHGTLVALNRVAGIRRACRRIPAAVQIALTFLLVTVGWVLFRVQSLGALRQVTRFGLLPDESALAWQVLVMIAIAYLAHFIERELAVNRVVARHRLLQSAAYAVCLLVVLMMHRKTSAFIYFLF